jgi:hypothetical protein
MENEEYKEVYFHLFCPDCKHRKTPMTDGPCDECLSNPTNLHSHKPVNWTRDENKK